VSDVIVVGAGIIGCAVAEALVRARAQVTVIDPRGPGLGATQASAGMLTPYSEGRHDPRLEELGARSLSLYDDLVARVAPRLDAALFYARTGSLEVALDETEAEELRIRAADLAARGIANTYLPGPEARQFERELAVGCTGALLIPAHGYASAPRLTAALWRASETSGASLVAAPVQRISPAAGGVIEVTTARGSYTAPTVVLAAGSWSGQIPIDDVPPLPVRPVRGQLLHLHWAQPALTRIVWGARCYAVPWPDGTVLVGATLEDVGFDERATVAGVRDLLDAICELVPAGWQASFAHVRVGLRPGTPDALPVVGRSSRLPGLIYATGHYRNGVLLAPLTAELVATIVAGGTDPALEVLSPRRFSAV
jgi:glycine oxidase